MCIQMYIYINMIYLKCYCFLKAKSKKCNRKLKYLDQNIVIFLILQNTSLKINFFLNLS